MAERVNSRVGKRASNEVEGEVEVSEGEVGEEQADELIDEFDVKEDLAAHGMIGLPDLFEVHKRVDSGKEGTVQPSPTLGDEFRNRIWKVSTLRDIGQINLPGTSVSPVQLLTYFNTHFSSLFATNSQQRMRSSAKYMFAVNTSAF